MATSMTAEDVKDALRKRHPAWSQGMVGEWTCLEEWANVDLIAVSAWSRNRVVGYEVKVSRSDMRRELLSPSKRAASVAGCHEFYFAVPAGLYTDQEIAFREPEWTQDDFRRPSCPGVPGMGSERSLVAFRGSVTDPEQEITYRDYGGPCSHHYGRRSGATVKVPVPVALDHPSYGADYTHIECPTCGGKGYSDVSRVEREAPTLWVPRDVGLVTVTPRGSRVVRRAPSRFPERPLIPKGAASLVRWVSVRPDPRHTARREEQTSA